MIVLRIRALGTAEIEVGTTEIRPDSMVLFALSLYLGQTAGQRLPRAHLLDLLWAGVEESSRRHSLRQMLYRLRQCGLDISVDREEVFIEREMVDSDLDALFAEKWTESASEAEVLAAASVLPRYTPPMPAGFREWLGDLRERAESQFRRAAVRHIRFARCECRWADLEDWARRCLEVDPMNEEATCARAEALAMTGSTQRAREILDDYLADLREGGKELGLPVRLLRQRILEMGEPAVPSRSHRVPLVGRASTITLLNDLLTSRPNGLPGCAMVVGVPGIGKSAVAQEFIDGARLKGWQTAVTRLQPSDVHRPLSVFIDLFGDLLKRRGALGCDPRSFTQLQRLTEHTVPDVSAGAKSQEAEAVQERIRSAAVDLLGAVSEEGPLIVLLEDIHWLDGQSTRLLAHLVTCSRGMPLLWLLTARAEANYASVRESLPQELARGVRLEPLSTTDTVELFRAFGGDSEGADNSVRHEIVDAVTGGNPLFIREVAQHIAANGDVEGLPNSLRALIHGRVERLQQAAKQVLYACAVLGRYSSVPRVARVLEIPTVGLLAGIEDVHALGIVGVGKDTGALTLHDLWQEELLSSLPAASRQLIHHRCGLVLEDESRGTRSAAIVWEAARHLKLGGEPARALSLLESSAQHLLDNGLPVEAARTFELALETATTDHQRLRAFGGRLTALQRAGDWVEVARAVEPAIALETRVSPSETPHSEFELIGTECLWRTERDTNASMERAISCATDPAAPVSHRLHAALLATLTASNLARLETLRCLNDMVGSLAYSSAHDRANALGVKTVFHTEVGSLLTARGVAEELVALERETGSVRGLSRALRFYCYPLRCLGDFEHALVIAREGLDLARRHQLIGDAAFAAEMVVTVHLEREDIDRAAASCAEAEHWAERVRANYPAAAQNINQAIIALARGDPATALARVNPDPQYHRRDPVVRQRLLHLSILSRARAARGESELLPSLLTSLREGLDQTWSTGRQDYLIASYSIALVAMGRTDDATSYVTDYVQHARRDRSPLSRELRGLRVGANLGQS